MKIDEIKLLDYIDKTGLIKIKITCQSGTYIRSIARDLGEKLETLAHLSELHREWIAPFENETYRSDTEIEAKHIISLDTAFKKFPQVALTQKHVQDLFHGKIIELKTQAECAAYHQNQFIGIIAPHNANQTKSIKLISQKNMNSR